MTTTTLQRISRNETSIESVMSAAGIGAMETEEGNLPLKQLQVRSTVDGIFCRTAITQRFKNPHSEFVEATYIFPLPGRFAVTECKMQLKGHTIVAELKERAEARADYDQAIQQGKSASILEEERSETFSLRVGNIPPGEEISVELSLVGCLSIVDSEATIRIPLLVAPRYIAGNPIPGPQVGKGIEMDTDAVPDASRISPPVLLKGFPNPVELSVEVCVTNPFAQQPGWQSQIQSSLHSVLVTEGEDCVIKLRPGERLDRDFILRFPVLSEELQSCLKLGPVSTVENSDDSVLESMQQSGGRQTFAITLLPPTSAIDAERPRDVVFVLDRSGSMHGWKIAAARRAVARMIDSLSEQDRFSVIAFDDDTDFFGKNEIRFTSASDQNRWAAAEWTAKIDARGGTELGGAMLAALRHFSSFGMPESRESIVVLVTDGQVGGEDSILRTIESLQLPRLPRMFTMGIDRAVNAGLLQRLADMGEGCFELVESEERLDQVMQRFHETINSPIVSDIKIEPVDCELDLDSLSPNRGLSVFCQRPLTVFGQLRGNANNIRARVSGKLADGTKWEQLISSAAADADMLRPLWGRGRIRDLEDEYAKGNSDLAKLQKQIVHVSLGSSVLSRFTAYIAIDSEIANRGGKQHEIVQPVDMPETWEMERCFAAAAAPMAFETQLRKAGGGMSNGLSDSDGFRHFCEPNRYGAASGEMDTDGQLFCDLLIEQNRSPGDLTTLFADAVDAAASHAIFLTTDESVLVFFVVENKLVKWRKLDLSQYRLVVLQLRDLARRGDTTANINSVSLNIGTTEKRAFIFFEKVKELPNIVLNFSDDPGLQTGLADIDHLLAAME